MLKRFAGGTIQLTIWCTPNAKKNAIQGIKHQAIWVSICAPARESLANEGLIRYLSLCMSCPPSKIRLVSGQKSRLKRIHFVDLREDETKSLYQALSQFVHVNPQFIASC